LPTGTILCKAAEPIHVRHLRSHLAKAYQIKQVRKVLLDYKLAGESNAK